MTSAGARAKELGLEFNLSMSKVSAAISAGGCEATGIPFDMNVDRLRQKDRLIRRSPWTPSLDRKDPAQGYTDKNTRVVVWLFNAAKESFTDADVMTMARAFVATDLS